MDSAVTMTIREAWLQASSFLQNNDVEDGREASQLLIQHVLRLDTSAFYMSLAEPFPPERIGVLNDLLARRANGEPAQYLIGEQEFYGIPLRVTPAVLIPRPETELLVEQAIRIGRRLWPDSAPSIADICCGSGAIAIAIAENCSTWNVSASDLSAAALEVARGNALACGLNERIVFYEGDLLEPYIQIGARIDMLLSNPPYIESKQIAGLQREVRREPLLALDGGADGLDCYRRMLGQLERLPAIPAVVGFELGQGQAPEVSRLMQQTGWWPSIVTVPDLAGIDRHVIGISQKIID